MVGKSGEEIWVDKYGRVKVQFYWDRQGKKDEKSSCWIRVSQPWAGKNWGAMWIPRMGQEVIVDFLEGDPDRPLITGRVYNAEEDRALHLARPPDGQYVSSPAAPKVAAARTTTRSASKTRRAASRSSSTPKKTWICASRTTRANT